MSPLLANAVNVLCVCCVLALLHLPAAPPAENKRMCIGGCLLLTVTAGHSSPNPAPSTATTTDGSQPVGSCTAVVGLLCVCGVLFFFYV